MDKKAMLKYVNIALALAFLGSAGGGMVRGLAPEAIPYSLFHTIHPLFGYALVVCAVLHLWLNWAWIRMTFFAKRNKRPA